MHDAAPRGKPQASIGVASSIQVLASGLRTAGKFAFTDQSGNHRAGKRARLSGRRLEPAKRLTVEVEKAGLASDPEGAVRILRQLGDDLRRAVAGRPHRVVHLAQRLSLRIGRLRRAAYLKHREDGNWTKVSADHDERRRWQLHWTVGTA